MMSVKVVVAVLQHSKKVQEKIAQRSGQHITEEVFKLLNLVATGLNLRPLHNCFHKNILDAAIIGSVRNCEQMPDMIDKQRKVAYTLTDPAGLGFTYSSSCNVAELIDSALL